MLALYSYLCIMMSLSTSDENEQNRVKNHFTLNNVQNLKSSNSSVNDEGSLSEDHLLEYLQFVVQFAKAEVKILHNE